MKTIKIMLEIPEKWIDIDSPSLLFSYEIREQFIKKLEQAVIETINKGLILPKLPKITEKEIKEKMLEILAHKALKQINNE